MPGRAHALHLPPAESSFIVAVLAECLCECVACPSKRMGEPAGEVAYLVAVVSAGVREVVCERSSFAAARILARKDALVRAAVHPSLQFRGAHGAERVIAERGVEQLEHGIPCPTFRLVLCCLTKELVEA